MPLIAQHYFTNIKGLKTHHLVLGKGPQKVLFLHGWGGSWKSFWLLGLDLVAQNAELELILLDMPGFGQTQNPPAEGFSTHDYKDFVQAFIEEQGLDTASLNFYIHSFGGRVLVPWILDHPENKGKHIFTGSAGVKWEPTFRQKISIWMSTHSSAFKRIFPARIQKFIVTRILGARDWGVVKPELKTTLKKVLAESDFRDDLKKISNQCLILWGAKDHTTPLKSGKIFAENLQNAHLEVFPTGRHGIHHTHRKEVVDLCVNFL